MSRSHRAPCGYLDGAGDEEVDMPRLHLSTAATESGVSEINIRRIAGRGGPPALEILGDGKLGWQGHAVAPAREWVDRIAAARRRATATTHTTTT